MKKRAVSALTALGPWVAISALLVGTVAAAAAPSKPATPAQGTTASVVQSFTIDAGALVQQSTLSGSAIPGDIQIAIKNLLPKTTTSYTLTVDVENQRVVPPVLPAPGGTAVAAAAPPSCSDKISEYTNALNSQTTELEITHIGGEFTSLMTETSSPCKTADEQAAAKNALAAFQQATTAMITNISIAAGQRLIITLMRNANGTMVTEKVIGRYVIATAPQPSQWLVFYGANFINTADQQFYSNANAGTKPATYTITRQANRSSRQFAPSVSFMWLPAQNFACDAAHWLGGCVGRAAAWRGETSDIFGGLSAGLGFGTSNNTANPVVFLGYGVGWGYNVLVAAGVAMHQEKRLVGQYNSGQVISENLTPDQLAQSAYRPGFFIGIAFRFGSNPFGSKSDTTKTSTQASGTPATPAK